MLYYKRKNIILFLKLCIDGHFIKINNNNNNKRAREIMSKLFSKNKKKKKPTKIDEKRNI